jgi:hypothetical protein
MKETRILVGIMALSLGLGMAGPAMAQRGGGQGGSSIQRRVKFPEACFDE